MAELPKTHNPNEMVVSMPPAITKSWLLDFLIEKLGGTPIEGQGLMFQGEAHVNRQSEVQVIVHTITYDVDQTSGSVSGQEGHNFRMLEKKQDSSIPTLSFYRNGNFFWVGKPDKEVFLKNLKGLQSIHFLLQYPEKYIQSSKVHDLGKTSGIDDVVLNDDELVNKGTPNIHIRALDDKARAAYKDRIEELYIKLNRLDINPEEALEIKEEIEKLKASLKERTIYKANSQEENARTAVLRNIQRALATIHKEFPDLKRYLNKSTIKTGALCSYAPIPSDPVEWKLF